ncbi:MAG: SGNH/GDSL hydrolase family protein [Actinobacteria bacterium]|nr:SGNH/GDSL hydrolase family protein [Actinomycetota bacterium]
MVKPTQRRPLSALAASGLLALTAPLAAQAQSDDTTYVALGDSYSAGVGTYAPTDSCYRSPYGYPVLIAQRRALQLNYQACSGAVTSDVAANQVGSLTSATDYVTMTIGGNDVGFADVITECAQPGWISNCKGAISDARTILNQRMPGRYHNLFATIDNRAPNADIVIGGYPRLFNGEDCNLATFFSGSEMSSLNSATDELDNLIRSTSTNAGFDYVDPGRAFLGHAVCDDTEWINGLSYPIIESYHPNRAGNVGYANVFLPALSTTSRQSQQSRTTAEAPKSAEMRAMAQYVLAMNLDSSAHLKRAKAAGINPRQIEKITADLRSADTKKIVKAMEKLQRFDRRFEAAQQRDS